MNKSRPLYTSIFNKHIYKLIGFDFFKVSSLKRIKLNKIF